VHLASSRRVRPLIAVVVSAVLATIGLTAVAPRAMAAGTPNITASITAPANPLLGSTVPVVVSATNPTGTDGFNALYRLVLPAGASLASATPSPTAQIAGGGGTTIVLWQNVADLLAGVTDSVTANVTFSGSTPAAATFSGGVYVNSDARTVPTYNASGGAVASSYTGSGTSSATSNLVPFEITKTTHAPENEVIRGVHDHKTVVSLKVQNNYVGPSTAFALVDYLPAELEFLRCGSDDNSATGTEEYAGSGRISDTPAPAMANPCVTPTSVDTVTVDPPGPQPSGIYTVVTWSSATLAAALGSSALATSASFTIDYVMAVPEHANVLFGTGAPSATSDLQASNLDNNTGASTQEGGTETEVVNVAQVSGTYQGTGYTDTDENRVTLEDLAIQKGVDLSTIAQGQTSTWTLTSEVSEYSSTATGLTVTDTVPDGLCPLGAGSPDAECSGGPGPSRAYSSATENSDGTWTLVWNLPDEVANDTTTLTFTTRTRTNYQEGFADAAPVRANDSWTNTVALDGSVRELGATPRLVHDASSAGQSAIGDSLVKEVAAPVAGTCGDGSALSWQHGLSSTTFGPGDTVCWRITAQTPANLDSTGLRLTDFLPAAYAYVGSVRGSQSTVDFDAPTVNGSVVAWTLQGGTGDVDAGQIAQVVLTTSIASPNAGTVGDLKNNLAKLSYKNTAGTPFQLRDDSDAPWREAILAISKTASPTTAVSGGSVTYTVTVRNNGNQAAQNAAVRDILPTRLSCGDITGLTAGYTCSGGQINGTIAALAAGAASSFTYAATLPADVAPGEQFVNHTGVRQFQTATDTGGTFTYVPSSNIDPSLESSANTSRVDTTATVTARAATITKTHTTSVVESGNSASAATVGEHVAYTATTTLPASTTIENATIVDTLPATLALDAAPAPTVLVDGAVDPAVTVSTAGNTVTVSFGSSYDIPSGADRVVTLTYSATVRDVAGVVAGTPIGNTATLTYTPPGGSPVTRAATDSTPVVEPDLGVTKSDDDADHVATPGELITYHVAVDDAAGSSVAHDSVVVDTIPTSMNPVDGGGAAVADGGTVPPQNGVWDATARTITWTVASIAPGAATTLDYTLRVANPIPVPSTFTNSVTAETTSLGGTVAGERTAGSGIDLARYRATATDTVGSPRPSITKSVSPSSLAVGEAGTYTVAVTVPADISTFDATVLDTLPAGLTYLDTQSAACTAPAGCADPVTSLGASGQNVGWFLGDLAPAPQARVFTITYRAVVADVAAATDGATLTNQARVAYNASDKISGTPATPPALGGFDAASGPATADVTVVEPRITLDKNVSGAGASDARRVKPGDLLDFSIVLSNTGSGTAYHVVVPDTVDPRMIPVSIADGSGWTVTDADPTDGTLGFLVDSIAAGDSVTITYSMRVPALTSADEVPGPELSNTADATYRSAPAGSPGTPRSYDDVTPDTVDLEVDLASVGDLVWFDANDNGIQDPGEPGLAGVPVTVTYLGPDGVLGGGDDEVMTTTTGPDGSWHVGDLPGGSYRTAVDTTAFPAGTSAGHDLDGGADATADYTLGEAQNRTDVDFAAVGDAAIGDLVWLDLDTNGARNGQEPGLPGIGVDVTSGGPDGVLGTADDVAYHTVTAADGSWQVSGLPAGPVSVVLDPATFPVGVTPVSDPDAGAPNGRAAGTLSAGQHDLTYDFGLAGSAELGDRVWVDTNRDGVQDPGEPGVPGATVQATWAGVDGVLGTADDVVLTRTTGANGGYLFDNLPAGGFTVAVTSLPTALAPTYDEEHGTTGPTGTTTVTLATGASHRTADFGYVAETGVGDTIWLDRNGDGIQDAGEPGIPGVEVTVTSAGADGVLDTADDIVDTATTDATGHYLVVGLPAGPTRVAVTGGLPAGVTQSYDADGLGTPDASVVTLADGVTDLDQDFGYQGANSIGDLVWLDVDANGTADAGEPGMAGVQVQVTFLGADGVLGGGDDMVVTATTDASGAYAVTGLPDGAYTVDVVGGVPAGYSPTYDETGPADGSSTVTGLGTVGPRDHLSADFGYTGDGTLGGTVWFDTNRNGVQAGGTEPGLGGIGIDVVWAGPDGIVGTPDDVTYRATTAADGSWVVEHLPPGAFRATVDPTTLPTGVTVVFDREHGTTSPDGVWDGTLAAGESRLDVDTGVSGTGSVGDLVWVDTNRNGTRDAGEKGAAGVSVTVTWYGPDGVSGGGDDVVFVTTTSARGGYDVTGLPPGEYDVTIDRATLPKGTRPGSDLDKGSATATRITLDEGATRTDVDFALWVPPALAFTGADIVPLGLIGLSLLAAGGVLVLVAARRRRGHGQLA